MLSIMAPARSVQARLVQVVPRLVRIMARALEGLDPPLSVRQFLVLQRIDEGARRNVDLARVIRVSGPTMSGVVDRLVSMGLVERVLDEDDRRAVSLSLTPEGRAVLASHSRRLEAELGKLLAHVGHRGRTELSKGIDVLDAALESKRARARAVILDAPASGRGRR
jgi:DNA-binding MarR family transcriptional regulator